MAAKEAGVEVRLREPAQRVGNRVIGPQPAPTGVKLEPFECGATAIQQSNVRAVPVKYYAIAVLFVLFDLETVFLYVWALAAQPLTAPLVVAFAAFTLLLGWLALGETIQGAQWLGIALIVAGARLAGSSP